MIRIHLRAAAVVVAGFLAQPALAIHIEQDHPDLQNPKARLVDQARAAEASLGGGTAQAAGSAFTSLNVEGMKRKPFPPGYHRSGYSFADEDLAPEPKADAAKPAQPASTEPAGIR